MSRHGNALHPHLKAAAIDILLDNHWLRISDAQTAHYVTSLLNAFWEEAQAADIIRDVQEIFPVDCATAFRAHCKRHYPEL